MGNTECCGRLKDEDNKFLMMAGDQYQGDKIPLEAYDIKLYSQVINGFGKDKIKFDELVQEFCLDKQSEYLAKDSPLIKQLNCLPGKVP